MKAITNLSRFSIHTLLSADRAFLSKFSPLRRYFLFLAFIVFLISPARSTSWGGFSFITNDVRIEYTDLSSELTAFPAYEVMECAHKLRLAKSLKDILGIKGKTYILFHPVDVSAFPPFTYIKYHSRWRKTNYIRKDEDFLRNLLNIWRRKGNAEELLQSLEDKGAPSLSRDGERIVYLFWKNGKKLARVEDKEGRKIWEWGEVEYEPVISPDGQKVAFISQGKLYIKNFAENYFYKHPLPPEPEGFFPIGGGFVILSDSFVAYGRMGLSKNPVFDLFFYRGKRMIYSTACVDSGHIESLFHFLWSPNNRLLLFVPQVLYENKNWVRKFFVIDVIGKKTREFHLLPAHYSFLWDGERGIYLATKGKRKGEIFYLDLKSGKIRRIYSCGEPLKAFMEIEESFLFRRGNSKLLILNKGKFSLKPAQFYEYNINQYPYYSVADVISNPPEPGEIDGESEMGAFRGKLLTICVIEDIKPKSSSYQLFFPYGGEWGNGEVKNIILTPEMFSLFRESLKRYSPLSLDIQENTGIFLLHSPNGGCTKLIRITFEGESVCL